MANPFDDVTLNLTDKEKEALKGKMYAHVQLRLTTPFTKENIWSTDEEKKVFESEVKKIFGSMRMLVTKEPQSEQGYFRIVRIDGSDKTDFYINGNELVGYVAQKDYASIIKSLQGMKSIEAMSEVSFVEVPSLTKKKLKKILSRPDNVEMIARKVLDNYDTEEMKNSAVKNKSGIPSYPTGKDFCTSNVMKGLHVMGETVGYTPMSTAAGYINKMTDDAVSGELTMENVQEYSQEYGGADQSQGQGYDKDDD